MGLAAADELEEVEGVLPLPSPRAERQRGGLTTAAGGGGLRLAERPASARVPARLPPRRAAQAARAAPVPAGLPLHRAARTALAPPACRHAEQPAPPRPCPPAAAPNSQRCVGPHPPAVASVPARRRVGARPPLGPSGAGAACTSTKSSCTPPSTASTRRPYIPP
ncbi:basic proline-rich protein-like [Panicum virgatum]|uniref:basic proline-rich protein-like n=1 Tax=Panicum virgatum TaxID=38727 RepID=UPI0019D544C9|nr:basic proline-rich protein-like [Panicum virgatum]